MLKDRGFAVLRQLMFRRNKWNISQKGPGELQEKPGPNSYDELVGQRERRSHQVNGRTQNHVPANEGFPNPPRIPRRNYSSVLPEMRTCWSISKNRN